MYGLVLIIVLFVLVIAFSGGESSSGSTTTTQSETADATEEVIVINSKELSKAYEGNEVAADKQYKGKTLEVTGKISGIDSGFGDEAIVRLSGSNGLNNNYASGDDSFNEYASTLSKGQTVTLICKGNGENLGSPSLSDCKPKQ